MTENYRDMLLGRLTSPVLSMREQFLYRRAALVALLDDGMDPLEIARRMPIELRSVKHGDRMRWSATWQNLTPGYAVFGETMDEACANLVLSLRHYDPDDR